MEPEALTLMISVNTVVVAGWVYNSTDIFRIVCVSTRMTFPNGSSILPSKVADNLGLHIIVHHSWPAACFVPSRSRVACRWLPRQTARLIEKG